MLPLWYVLLIKFVFDNKHQKRYGNMPNFMKSSSEVFASYVMIYVYILYLRSGFRLLASTSNFSCLASTLFSNYTVVFLTYSSVTTYLNFL